jgi:hypothetical protein
MTFTDFLIITMLIVMSSISGLIAYEFKKSTEMGKLRTLWLELFLSKTYLYASTAIYFAATLCGYLHLISLAWVLFLINLPTFVAKVRLYMFIKK